VLADTLADAPAAALAEVAAEIEEDALLLAAGGAPPASSRGCSCARLAAGAASSEGAWSKRKVAMP